LRFLLRHRCCFAIPKAVEQRHVEDNAAALNLSLSADEFARIDAAFPIGAAPLSLPMI
jgi:diketogulonate reductase-like aldo/keto reductase